MPHVSSTLTAAQKYTIWEERIPGQPESVREIRIEGGANTASKHFVTLDGVVTQVTDEQVELLLKIPAFVKHQELGFVKIHNRSKVDIKGLEAEDKSAPITPKSARKKRLAKPMKSEG